MRHPAGRRFLFFWLKENDKQNDERSLLIPKDNGMDEAVAFGFHNRSILHAEAEGRHTGPTVEVQIHQEQPNHIASPREEVRTAVSSLQPGTSWDASVFLDEAVLKCKASKAEEGLALLPPQKWDQKPASLTNSCVKYLMFLSNLLFAVFGLLILAIGLWGLVDKESFAQERIRHIGSDPMLVIAGLGLLLSLLCFTGCVGALRENVPLLKGFAAGVLVLLSIQVLTGFVMYMLRDQIEGFLRSSMLTAVSRYQDDLDLRFIMDEMQIELQCCGADTYHDWELNMYFNCSAPGIQACGVPATCCIDPLENGTVWNSQCGLGAQGLDEFTAQRLIYLGGCLGGLSRWLSNHTGSLATAASLLLGAQVLSLFIATRILRDIDRVEAGWQPQ
ncbi:tetraspanin-10 [Polyodon spathula]|nr:tetraspanin-10 [Polyodon spathula]XP_041077694.1 tetraspanin-10 [Polyodon spathula]